MMETFWGPGVATAIETPERVSFQRRFGWGLTVRQRADPEPGASNWFHIPIPSKSRNHYVGGTQVMKAILSAEVNENARIAEIHLRDSNLIMSTGENIIGRRVLQEYVGPTRSPLWIAFDGEPAGITLCVRVEFLTGTPMGQVTFFGAGVQLDILD